MNIILGLGSEMPNPSPFHKSVIICYHNGIAECHTSILNNAYNVFSGIYC